MVSGVGHEGLDAPRVRFRFELRGLLLSLAVLGIAAFIARGLVVHPEGHTVRRLAIAVVALAVGVAGLTQSIGRACSGCSAWLKQLSIRGSEQTLTELTETLRACSLRPTEQILRRLAGGESFGTTASLEISYCEGCGRLISWHLSTAGGTRETLAESGASALSSLLAAYPPQPGRDG